MGVFYMNGQYLILNMRKAVYYVNDLFEPDTFRPCSTEFFYSIVVKHRKCFTMKYLEGGVQLFEDINSEIKFKRRWL